MATKRTFSAGIDSGRLPGGRTRPGSRAFHRRAFGQNARASFADIQARYADIIRRLRIQSPMAIKDALYPVLVKSLIYCPEDTGLLRSTGEIGAEQAGKNARGWIKYGSQQAWYAAIVHERMDLYHAPPTRAKFLQSAMEEEMDSFLTSLAVHYAGVLR